MKTTYATWTLYIRVYTNRCMPILTSPWQYTVQMQCKLLATLPVAGIKPAPAAYAAVHHYTTPVLMLGCCFPPNWRANRANDSRFKAKSPSVWNHTNPLASKRESPPCDVKHFAVITIQFNWINFTHQPLASQVHLMVANHEPWQNTVQSRCVLAKFPWKQQI